MSIATGCGLIYCEEEVSSCSEPRPRCDSIEREVRSCEDASGSCREIEYCDSSISCVVDEFFCEVPPEERPPVFCPEGMEEVESCEGRGEECAVITDGCDDPIYCIPER